MDVLGDGDEPGVELEFRVVRRNLIERLGESFDRDVVCIGFVFGAFEHETINLIPIPVEQECKRRLVAGLCPFDILVYFQCTGFEKILLKKTFSCTKISANSNTG